MTLANFMGPRRLVWLAAAYSAVMLAVALVSQYGFGLYPCELCLAQRVPYALIVALGVGAWLVRSPKVWMWMALGVTALFFVDAGIAYYHFGVELHIFKGPSACTASTEPQTLEEMRAALLNAALVSCDQPMLHVLGLSMAGWNALAACAGGAAMFWSLCAMRKARKA